MSWLSSFVYQRKISWSLHPLNHTFLSPFSTHVFRGSPRWWSTSASASRTAHSGSKSGWVTPWSASPTGWNRLSPTPDVTTLRRAGPAWFLLPIAFPRYWLGSRCEKMLGLLLAGGWLLGGIAFECCNRDMTRVCNFPMKFSDRKIAPRNQISR